LVHLWAREHQSSGDALVAEAVVKKRKPLVFSPTQWTLTIMSRIEMHIAKPCNQSWAAMAGDDRVRHCGVCRKNVFNIAEMTAAEVEALIRETNGRFCARLYRRADGGVMTKDCPKGLAKVRRKRAFALAQVGVTMLLAGSLSGCMGSTGSGSETGDVAVAPQKAAPAQKIPVIQKRQE
jgi:hypothetical protein